MRLKYFILSILFSLPYVSYAIEGSGTSQDPYKVGSAADLEELSDMVNGLNGQPVLQSKIYVTQVADIVFDGTKPFTPIGSYIYNGEWEGEGTRMTFDGKYDGGGYKIKGLYIVQPDFDKLKKQFSNGEIGKFPHGPAGLFGILNFNSQITNVKIEDATILGREYMGAICGQSFDYSTIKNCKISNTTIEGVKEESRQYGSYMGGICGNSTSRIDSCQFEGVIKGVTRLGGICGTSERYITNCKTYGEIICESNGGGISGSTGDSIAFCENYSSVIGSSSNVAGICGSAGDNINCCHNYGNIKGRSNVGGICGQIPGNSTFIRGCSNSGNIEGSDKNAGGIIGYAYYSDLYADFQVSFCANYGTVTGIDYVGGIAGYANCISCMNFGAVKGVESVGGLVGTGNPDNSINASTVSGETEVGAICGKILKVTYTRNANYYNIDSCGLNAYSANNSEKDVEYIPLSTTQMVGINALSNMDKLNVKGQYFIYEDTIPNKVFYPQVLSLKGIIDPVGITVDEKYDKDGFCNEYNTVEAPILRNGIYEIANAGQLYWFSCIVNQVSKSCYYNAKLINDIVFNDSIFDGNGDLMANTENLREWQPIGKRYETINTREDDATYRGVFDGQGHFIKGLYFNKPTVYDDNKKEESGVGLFGYIKNGHIKNVSLVDCYFNCEDNVGGIACYAPQTRVESCTVSGVISTTGGNAGGIVCKNSKGFITDCQNHATIRQSYVKGGAPTIYAILDNYYPIGSGGICANCDTVVNCVNYGDVHGSYNIAGIVASSDAGFIKGCINMSDIIGEGSFHSGICAGLNSGTIVDCVNNGKFIGKWATAENAYGGINAVNYKSSAIKNCTNNGDITTHQLSYEVGGICGYNYKGSISNCENNGSISNINGDHDNFAGYDVGGIAGANFSDISSCTNNGAISVPNMDAVGGIVGGASTAGLISNCINTADVQGSEEVGGICGSQINNEDSEISYCANYGEIVGKSKCGGVVGFAHRGNMRCSYNRGNVMAKTNFSGGLVGLGNNYVIKDCYNTGEIGGKEDVAGLIGSANSCAVSNSYNIGNCMDISYGTFSQVSGEFSVENIYSNMDSCIYNSSNFNGENNIDSLHTNYMIGENALQHMAALDYENTWYVTPNEAEKFYYPHLIAFKGKTEAPYTYYRTTNTKTIQGGKSFTYSIKKQIYHISEEQEPISIYNVSGQMLKTIQCKRGTNNLGTYAPGIYYVNGEKVLVK